VPRVRFEARIQIFEWVKTFHALDRLATVAGQSYRCVDVSDVNWHKEINTDSGMANGAMLRCNVLSYGHHCATATIETVEVPQRQGAVDN
jgi:hypothetical protein